MAPRNGVVREGISHMNDRTLIGLKWAAWVMATLAMAAVVGAGVFAWLVHRAGGVAVAPLVGPVALVMAIGFSAVGLLIVYKQPRNVVGYMLVVSGTAAAMSVFAAAYAVYTLLARPDSLPAAALMTWLSHWMFYVTLALAPLELQLFPNGRPVSARWRPLIWLATGTAVLTMVMALGLPLAEYRSYDLPVENPIVLWGSSALLSGTSVYAPALFAMALASLVARARQGSSEERAQAKWLLYATGFAVALLLVTALVPPVSDLDQVALESIIATFPAAILGAMAIGILRHNLWDIDVVINRTLVYGALTLVLAGIYLGSIIGLQAVFRAATGQNNDVAIVVSMLAIAALFMPFRRRMQNLIDQRFYRRRYDAAQTLAAFGTRIRDEVDVERLTGELVSVVEETMQPTHASLWLREPERQRAKLPSEGP